MIALYQNGERLMPGNGYPMRLLLPGWEGNMNVKWLRRVKLVDQPGMSYYEARTYAPILPNGKAYQFYFLQEVKSFITHPSPGLKMSGPGFYEISGVAYSANGRIAKVMVTADGGKTWAQAALQEPVHVESVHALPTAVEVGRRTGSAAKPRVGRGGQRAADARAGRRAARSDENARHQSGRVPEPALQRAHELGDRSDMARSNMSTRRAFVSRRSYLGSTCVVGLVCVRSPSRHARHRVSESRSPNPTSPRGTSASCPTAPACRRAAARPNRARRSSRPSAPCATARTAKGGTRAALVGGEPLTSGIDTAKTIANFWPYATTIFDFTRRAMPWPRPRTLTNDEVYALTAYILSQNKIIGAADVMNAQTLPKVACRTATASSNDSRNAFPEVRVCAMIRTP